MATSIGSEGTLKAFFKQAAHWVDNVQISWKKWRGTWVLASDKNGKPHPLMTETGEVPIALVDVGTGKIESDDGDNPIVVGAVGEVVWITSAVMIDGGAATVRSLASGGDLLSKSINFGAGGQENFLDGGMLAVPGGTIVTITGGLEADAWTLTWLEV